MGKQPMPRMVTILVQLASPSRVRQSQQLLQLFVEGYHSCTRSDEGLSNFSRVFEAAMKVPYCTVSVKPMGTLSTSRFPPHTSLLGSSPDAVRSYHWS